MVVEMRKWCPRKNVKNDEGDVASPSLESAPPSSAPPHVPRESKFGGKFKSNSIPRFFPRGFCRHSAV